MNRRPNDFKAVMDALATERKAEQAAEKSPSCCSWRKVKEVTNAWQESDDWCRQTCDAENLGENAVLLLVEGKSAGGAMQRVRDPKYGILKLRGKIINAFFPMIWIRCSLMKRSLFFPAITGINISNYRESKFRYGKVAICVDADDDGMHIACLIIALLYKFAPEFLKEGRLCLAHAPLFKVTSGKHQVFLHRRTVIRQKHWHKKPFQRSWWEMKDEDSRDVWTRPVVGAVVLGWLLLPDLLRTWWVTIASRKRILCLAELILRIWWSNGVLYITSLYIIFTSENNYTARTPLSRDRTEPLFWVGGRVRAVYVQGVYMNILHITTKILI